MPEPTKQIFIRGLSRSGGTLTVTLLDAHPEVAMSYELYESLLDPEGDAGFKPDKVLEWLTPRGLFKRRVSIDKLPHRGLRTFLSRINRGGLNLDDFRELLRAHCDRGLGFEDVGHRLRLVEACSARKMQREGKRHWGLKCNNRFEDYQAAFANSYFINVIRDGRDVLASQLHTGKFKTPPEELGRSWAQTHLRFRRWSRSAGVRGHELFYERLAHEPEREVRGLCAFLGLEYDARMLAFHRSDLTIFKASHLSMKRISSPIDTSMIGRWRSDLTDEQAEAFCRGAGEALAQFGYLETAPAR
jgi:hypothetical protein